jgi:hypothetical protein
LLTLEPFESLYQSVVFLFNSIRAAATDAADASLNRLGASSAVKEAAVAASRNARQLQKMLASAREVSPSVTSEVAAVFRDSGVASLADDVSQPSADAPSILRTLLKRHHQVQSGKFDKGVPKAAWVAMADAHDRVRLPAQRYQLLPSQRRERWIDEPRHPYRTAGAFRFIDACRIR